jgi:hypothetical protein
VLQIVSRKDAVNKGTRHKQRPDIIFFSEDRRLPLFPPLILLCLICVVNVAILGARICINAYCRWLNMGAHVM